MIRKRDVRKVYLPQTGLFYCAAIWGSTFFIVKGSLVGIHPVILVGYRFTLAALILGIILAFKRKNLFANAREGLILGFFLGVLYLTQTMGLGMTTASNSGFITGMFVAFVPFFGFTVFRIVPSKISLVASVVAMGGLWMLTGGIGGVNYGDMLTLAAAMSYAIHLLYVDRFVKKKIDPYVLNFQQFLFIGLFALLMGAVFKLPFEVTGDKVIASVVFLALLPTLSAFVIQLSAQRYVHPVRVSLIFAFEPVFAAAFAWTLGNEPFVAARAAGGGLIVLALILSSFDNGK
ncbi:MAG: EamA family transporter [candidate division Zixibacteria bacterium]|nr:EamA family transporter [candidate division Zixibacteria bacterium]